MLGQWEQYDGHFQKRFNTDYSPLLDKLRAAQRQLAKQLDQILCKPAKGERWSKSRRSGVTRILLTIVENLLSGGPDAELSAMFDRHSEISLDEQQRLEMELAESALGEIFGADVLHGHTAEDVDALFRHAQERVAEKAEAEAEQREQQRAEQRQRPGAKPSRAEAAAARKEQAEQQSRQSLREVFRKLASSLHPDRETDPAERERKTELMKKINLAYQNNDLLTLLSLQIEVEQIDASALAKLPEARLKHYNQVLREQLQTLESDLRERIHRYLDALAAGPARAQPKRPQDIDWLLNQRLAEVRNILLELNRGVAALADPQRRRSQIDGLLAGLREEEEEAALFEMLDEAFELPSRARRRRR